MSAGLLKLSVADEDTTHTKLRLRQQQQARAQGLFCYEREGVIVCYNANRTLSFFLFFYKREGVIMCL